jgi:hypothetical protein
MVQRMVEPPSLLKMVSNITFMGITTKPIYKQPASLLMIGSAGSQLRQSIAPLSIPLKLTSF